MYFDYSFCVASSLIVCYKWHLLRMAFWNLLEQGSPTPWPQMEPVKEPPGPHSMGAPKASCVFPGTPHCLNYWLSTLCQTSGSFRILIGAQTLLWTAHTRDLGCVFMRIYCLVIWGGAEAVRLALGSSCKYRLSLAEKFDCTETIINQLLADAYQNPISEWQVTTELHLVAGYKTIPSPTHPTGPWKNCPPWNQSLVPKMLGTLS